MNKKKIGALLVAGILTLGVVGGTLAWFTSEDSVVNKFSTGDIENPEGANGNGVEIYEDFESPENLVPGADTTKLVQVQNTTTYDSFIRVKITPVFTEVGADAAANGTNLLDLSTSMIELDFGLNLGEEDGKWLLGEDGYYYFMGKVAGGTFTNALLESVKLSEAAGNEYRGCKFEVLVEAESIQADYDAHNDAWDSDDKATERLDELEESDATNITKIGSVKITD